MQPHPVKTPAHHMAPPAWLVSVSFLELFLRLRN